MRQRWIAVLGLAGLISFAACGGEEGAGADASADDMGSDTTMNTDGTGIAGQGGMDGTAGMGQEPVGQSVPSDTGGFGAGGIGGAGTGSRAGGQ
jgi:hypothetical protein